MSIIYKFLLFFVIIVSFLAIIISSNMINIDKNTSCKQKLVTISQEFRIIENNIDGNFYKFKKISKSDYPWITARVDINRSNDVWENDALKLMEKHGWSKHPIEAKSLCKDGSKFILESVDYNETTYQFVSILHDEITEEECKE